MDTCTQGAVLGCNGNSIAIGVTYVEDCGAPAGNSANTYFHFFWEDWDAFLVGLGTMIFKNFFTMASRPIKVRPVLFCLLYFLPITESDLSQGGSFPYSPLPLGWENDEKPWLLWNSHCHHETRVPQPSFSSETSWCTPPLGADPCPSMMTYCGPSVVT